MKRRKVLAGLGSLAAGGAAAMGTGAFSAVEAERDMTIDLVSDNNAYLKLAPTSKYASLSGDDDEELSLNFTRLNDDAMTEFTNVFQIGNTGDRRVAVWIDISAVPDKYNFNMYTGYEEPGSLGDGGGNIPPAPHNGVRVDPGGSFHASCIFGSYDGDIDDALTDDKTFPLTIYAISNDSELYPNAGPAEIGGPLFD